MADTISAVANLLWPLLVLGLVWIFRNQLRRLIGSVSEREMTIEVGGQKITLGELNVLQRKTIADLQKQMGLLQDTVDRLAAAAAPPTVEEVADDEEQEPSVPFAVLWVDDWPENNALEIAELRDNGVRVDLAGTTAEGLGLFRRNRYGIVVSDMGRTENGVDVPDAGLRLTSELRALDPTIPIVIYAGTRTKLTFGDRAVTAGATAITDSPTELSRHFRAVGLL